MHCRETTQHSRGQNKDTSCSLLNKFTQHVLLSVTRLHKWWHLSRAAAAPPKSDAVLLTATPVVSLCDDPFCDVTDTEPSTKPVRVWSWQLHSRATFQTQIYISYLQTVVNIVFRTLVSSDNRRIEDKHPAEGAIATYRRRRAGLGPAGATAGQLAVTQLAQSEALLKHWDIGAAGAALGRTAVLVGQTTQTVSISHRLLQNISSESNFRKIILKVPGLRKTPPQMLLWRSCTQALKYYIETLQTQFFYCNVKLQENGSVLYQTYIQKHTNNKIINFLFIY